MGRVGIVGEGKMGSNLFQYISGFDHEMFWLVSPDADVEKITRGWSKKVLRNLNANIITETDAGRMQRALISKDPEVMADCDLIIEAIPEDLELKKRLFTQMDSITADSCVFASNSSSILPSLLISSEKRADRTIGLHFFYPVALKNIVELVTCERTTPRVISWVTDFIRSIHRNMLHQTEQDPFLLNRIFLELQTEACQIAGEMQVSPSFIDMIVHERMFPLGPFECIDSVGLSVMLPAVRNYIQAYPDKSRYEPLIRYLSGSWPTEVRNRQDQGHKAGLIHQRLRRCLEEAIGQHGSGTLFDKNELIAAFNEYVGQ